MTQTNPDELAQRWLEAKAREAAANAERLAVEAAIVAALGAKPEGSQTHRLGGVSVTLTGRMTYAADDAERLRELAPDLFRATLNDTAVRRLRETDPARYRAIAPLLSVKPAKTAVTVKLLEEAA
jgi:hypothetical protein